MRTPLRARAQNGAKRQDSHVMHSVSFIQSVYNETLLPIFKTSPKSGRFTAGNIVGNIITRIKYSFRFIMNIICSVYVDPKISKSLLCLYH